MDKSVHITTRTRYGTDRDFGAQEQGSRVPVPAQVEVIVETSDEKRRLLIEIGPDGTIGPPRWKRQQK